MKEFIAGCSVKSGDLYGDSAEGVVVDIRGGWVVVGTDATNAEELETCAPALSFPFSLSVSPSFKRGAEYEI